MPETKVTVPGLIERKRQGPKIAALTAYDAVFAELLDTSGIDVVLVGDSLGMVIQGHETTLAVTLEQILYHTQAVRRGVRRALLVADMPFLSYQVSPEEALRNAGRLMKEGGAEAVKLEGGRPICETVRRLVDAGIPVMGHLGLTPQSIHHFGGYRVRGRSGEESEALLADALALEAAGAFAIVLEKIPSSVARTITEKVRIPTIGIGAGPHCDGQILVTYDMLGLFEKFRPKFVRRYAELASVIRESCRRYVEDVRQGSFPSDQESY
ncbi:MAG: 3-methyl-2-oxobutanoate hydroxymethyltransferase [candidate division KSB1 bacterium]|nr:3-methyl-2-oxobutanoate hydroxymethyltransferase [candidate division KSB1 bacterium]